MRNQKSQAIDLPEDHLRLRAIANDLAKDIYSTSEPIEFGPTKYSGDPLEHTIKFLTGLPPIKDVPLCELAFFDPADQNHSKFLDIVSAESNDLLNNYKAEMKRNIPSEKNAQSTVADIFTNKSPLENSRGTIVPNPALYGRAAIWDYFDTPDLNRVEVVGDNESQRVWCAGNFRIEEETRSEDLLTHSHSFLDGVSKRLKHDGLLALIVPFSRPPSSNSSSAQSLDLMERGGSLFVFARLNDSKNIADVVNEITSVVSRSLSDAVLEISHNEVELARKRVQGVEEAIEAFAHQIKWIAERSNNGWLVGVEKWDSQRGKIEERTEPIQNSNQNAEPDDEVKFSNSQVKLVFEKLKAVKLAPAPELYSALHRTLLLWTFTKKLDDLFPNTNPKSLSELFDFAAEYARYSRLLNFAKNKNISASFEKLLDVWLYEPDSNRKIQRCVTDDLQILPFTSFAKEDKDLASQYLSGLLRLFVIAIEDFFVHGKDDAELRFEFEVCDEDIWLTWKTTGLRKFPKENEFLGMSGTQVFYFVASKFLSDLNQFIPEDKEINDTFTRRIRFRKPNWLI